VDGEWTIDPERRRVDPGLGQEAFGRLATLLNEMNRAFEQRRGVGVGRAGPGVDHTERDQVVPEIVGKELARGEERAGDPGAERVRREPAIAALPDDRADGPVDDGNEPRVVDNAALLDAIQKGREPDDRRPGEANARQRGTFHDLGRRQTR
jgi:hypothetical protein